MTLADPVAERFSATDPAVRLGVVLLGQRSPASAARGELRRWLPAGVEVVTFGALDGVAGAELDDVRARPGDTRTLVGSLADGSTIVLDEERLLPYLEKAIARAESAGDVVLLSCTGTFPPLAHSKTLIFPDAAIAGTVGALVPASSHLGVLCPLPEQVKWIGHKYTAWAQCTVAAAMPSGPDAPATAARAAVALKEQGVSAIVMDCMGYSAAAAAAAKAATGLPVFLARRLTARVAAELL